MRRAGRDAECTVRPGLQAHARISREEEIPFVASTGFAVLRPKTRADSSFIFQQLFSNDVVAQLRSKEVGSNYPAVNESDVKQISIFMPEPAQRQAIGKVLDPIDEVIAKTETVIAKLKYVRTGMLHDLLSYGLDEQGQLRDPNAHPEQFKDSKLGRIPKEWNVSNLIDSINVIFDYRGRTPLKLNMEWGNGDIAALSANNVEMGRINFDKETYYGSEKLYQKWMSHGDTHKGDVLITMEAPLGNITQIPDDKKYILSQRVVLLRANSEFLENDFLALQMMAVQFQKELIRNSSGSTAVGIQRAKLEKIDVVVPENINEQIMIAEIIHSIDTEISSQEIELSKLRYIRFGLQDDLLTGLVPVPENIMQGASLA